MAGRRVFRGGWCAPSRREFSLRRSRLTWLAGILWLALATPGRAQVLFDATKAEMAGNADWVIDADAHNLGVSSASDGSGTRGGGTDSNPQRVPTPAITGITSATKETYWQGALSAWAVTLARNGQTVLETLPVFTTTTGTVRSRITYKDSTNAQDLANYRLFVVCEPNIAFTAAEKTAILNYVKNGGSLFMVADHSDSDRNNDGIDAVGVWNDLFSSNTVQTNPFGFTFNPDDVSPTKEFADTTATNPLTHGAAGTITQLVYADGSTMTISDATVAHAAVWVTSSKSSKEVMALYGTFGAGRFAAIGDSSPFDDGTGDSGDTLYDGWDDGGGNDGQLITNASLWLLAGVAPAATTTAASGVTATTAILNASVNPNGQATTAYFAYGPTTSYGSTTATQAIGAGSAVLPVSASLTGLAANATYHFRAVATNASGTTNGADLTFQTPLPPPSAVTTAASAVASSQGTLNATVNPEGLATTYHFDFGPTTAYGFTSVETSVGSGTSNVAVTLPVVGLAPGTTYHDRVTITSSAGTVVGADQTFTTAAFVDSDGDGLPDDYENARGLDPHNAADASLDADGDGQTNLAEYLAGTDPANVASAFRVLGVSSAGANVTVQFTTVFGKRYVVERAASLTAPNWTALGAALNGNGTPLSYPDANALPNGPGPVFYRVRIAP